MWIEEEVYAPSGRCLLPTPMKGLVGVNVHLFLGLLAERSQNQRETVANTLEAVSVIFTSESERRSAAAQNAPLSKLRTQIFRATLPDFIRHFTTDPPILH